MAVVTAMALTLALVATSLGPSGARAGELDIAVVRLMELRATMVKAEGKRRLKPQQELLKEAKEAKAIFREALVSGGGDGDRFLFGCDMFTAETAFTELENLDVHLEVAAKSETKRRKSEIGDAANAASGALQALNHCDPSVGVFVWPIADRIERQVARLDRKSPSDEKLQDATRRIEADKQDLMRGQKLFNCEAFRFYVLLKEIDVQIELALQEDDAGKRKGQIRKAVTAADGIDKLLPCDSSIAPPPDDGGGSPPPDGGTPPPSGSGCGNGVDDDADGAIDFPGDFGCFDAMDIGEKDMTFPVMCPDTTIGPTTTVVDFNFGAGTPNGYHLRDTAGGAVIHQSTTLNHPPTPANGTGICAGSDTFLVAGIGNQAPMCGGCPPVDEQTLRILVDNLPGPGAVASTKQGQAGVGTR
jgi:hypothetical protein